MSPLEGVRQALSSIRANKLRSVLTMLGVIVGVGAMILMVAVVEGFEVKVRKEFEGLGSRLVFAFYSPDQNERRQARRTFESLTLEDAEALRAHCDLVSNVTAELAILNGTVVASGREWPLQALAVEPTFTAVRGAVAERGRFINARDLERWRPVCVLGVEVAQKLFGKTDPIGKSLQLNGLRLTVVGILERKGETLGGNYDDVIYLPLTTAQKRLQGSDRITQVNAQARRPEDTEAAMDQIWRELMRRHENRPDFKVDSQTRLLESLSRITLILSGVLAGIAGLALLVGGIGIMNIMLASVTERTREIGIRKAVGAARRDILLQFLTEAMTLSGVGGVLGVGLGYAATAVVATVARESLPASVPVWAAAVGFSFACAVGLASGFYPAFRAARLDPIEALRYE